MKHSAKSKPKVLSVLIIILIIVIALFAGLRLTGILPRFSINRPEISYVFDVPLYNTIVPASAPGRPNEERIIKYVVIHETGNLAAGADAEAHSRLMESGDMGNTSWHYTVDDKEIYQHIPDNEIAWHAGDQRTEDGGNMCGIAVELCVNSDGDFEKTFANGAKLAAFLLNSYNLDISALKQHNDFSGKDCPEIIRRDGRWDEFVTLVNTYIDELQSDD